MKLSQRAARALLTTSLLGTAIAASAQWPTSYNGNANADDRASAIAISGDGSGDVFVTGASDGDTGYDYETIKYNRFGAQQWRRRFNGPTNGNDYPSAITSDALGNSYVTGASQASGGDDFLTIKYDAAGNVVWTKRLDGPFHGQDGANAISVNGKGEVGVTGWTQTTGFGRDYLTVEYSSTGIQNWKKTLTGDGTNEDNAIAIRADGGGSWYVFGTAFYNTTRQDYALVKYDGNGLKQWARKYNGTFGDGDDTAAAMDLDNLGNVLVTGTSANANGDNDYVTIKYDFNGNKLWLARQNSGGYSDNAVDIVVDGKNNVIVTGTSGWDIEVMDYLTVKYDSTGMKEWAKRYTAHTIVGGSYDVPCGVDVDDSGNVYVSGFTQGDPAGINMDFDYTTIKYTSGGTRLWVENFGGPDVHADDKATALVTDRARGKVYVTGYSLLDELLDYDFVTLKY